MEREFADKPAGFRTHMLVCATSSFFVLLAMITVSDGATRATVAPEIACTANRLQPALVTEITIAASVGPIMPNCSALRTPMRAARRAPSSTKPAIANVDVVSARPTELAGMPRSSTMP